MRKYTLLVVHMQPYFEESMEEQLLCAVEREIQRAIDRNCNILFLEFPYFSPRDEAGLPPTHSRLTDLSNNYKHCRTGYNRMFPGSNDEPAHNVISDCRRHNFRTKRLRVCGIYTGGWVRNEDGGMKSNGLKGKPLAWGCVFNMVYHLSQLLPKSKIKVVQDACRNPRNFQGQVHWEDFGNLPGVSVVSCGGIQ